MSQDITYKTENAVAKVILDALTTGSIACNIYKGMDNDEKETPAVICHCREADEDFPFSGIWHCNTNITVIETAADTNRETTTLSNSIFSALLTPNITQLLEAAQTEYGVISVMIRQPQTNLTVGDTWQKTLALDILCVHK